VRDSAALLDATAGPDLGDPYWAPPPARPFLEEVGRAPKPLRIALTTRPWNGQAVDPECETAAREAARLCESLGHTVEEARPDVDTATLGAATYVVIGANLRATLEARAAALGRPLEEADVERMTWRTAMHGHTQRAADYARAIGIMHRTARVVAPFFERYDVLLSPTMCRPPYRLGVIDMMTFDAEAYGQAVQSTIAFTSLWNSCGNPAMSVPLAWSRDGLPIGVQFVGRFGDEATLLRLAGQLETARPWAARRAPGVPGA
jgi:Asp-tRNA(Asn)/Glu-tRNA(Gln) amidotransferase A subunit family amidase